MARMTAADAAVAILEREGVTHAFGVPGAAIEAMSTAWKSSLCSRATGACPVMHRIGIESADAEYSPVIMSVPAGPEVPPHTPILPALARV